MVNEVAVDKQEPSMLGGCFPTGAFYKAKWNGVFQIHQRIYSIWAWVRLG